MDFSLLTMGQYSLVYNVMSLTIAAMFGTFIFVVLAKSQVGDKYKISLVVSSIVVAIAGYHYFRIFQSWESAFTLASGGYKPSGVPFNDAYRYVDWLITVPLLMVELVTVLALTKEKTSSLLTKLTIAAFLMIALGYPGESFHESTMFSNRGLWGTLSTIPFLYIMYILWVELGKALESQPAQVQVLVRNIRLLTIFTWGFYPIAYMAPFFGLSGAEAQVFLQAGYSIADILAKCGYGLMIYAIAREKTEYDKANNLA
ncbi:MAG: bacteriorhodopsin [Candidatus Sericytochromatia bacterium]|nr:bacteriorhodopsin [Candidatus Sericytochromatia bacterium]